MPEQFRQRTIRESLLGMVADHLNAGSITCGLTQQVGCELIALLAAYREEDRKLFPQVYLIGPCESDPIKVLAPASTPLYIGKTLDSDGARQTAIASLKNCATLAMDGWCVYIRRVSAGFEFGLFLPSSELYSTSAEETLAGSKLPVVLLRHSAENTVEILDGCDCRLEISLTTAASSSKAMSRHVFEFAAAACEEVLEVERSQAIGYLARVLTDCLRGSHGALLAAVPAEGALNRDELSDGVVLSDPIPIIRTMLAAKSGRDSASASTLRSQESLLRGMIGSDGVTVLGADGTIRAFRIFVQRNKTKTANEQPASGGARSRAFATLQEHVGGSLCAALFRSQDGRMEVVVKQ